MISLLGTVIGVLAGFFAFRLGYHIGRESFRAAPPRSALFPLWRRTPEGRGFLLGMAAALSVFIIIQLAAFWLESAV